MRPPPRRKNHHNSPVNAWPHILRSVAAVVLCAYPALVYFGMSSGSARQVSLVLLLAMSPAFILRLRKSSNQAMRGLAAVPLTTIAILSLAAILDHPDYIRATPVATNVVLLLAFSSTLRNRRNVMPMIERFARIQEENLNTEQQAWCRMWTWIWSLFFVANGSAALVFAVWGSLKWWALYNGLLCYGLIGMLLATEWLLRRRKFPSLAKSKAAGDSTPNNDTANETQP
ncbi:MAG: putative membrane protein [Planctomycetota bacterium]|jgi:uncharacterized membrane protein